MVKCEGMCQLIGLNLRAVSFEDVPYTLNLCAECEAILEKSKKIEPLSPLHPCDCGAWSSMKGFCSCKVVRR